MSATTAPLGLLLSVLTAAAAHAAASTATWRDTGELSYVEASGNGPTQTFSASNELGYRPAAGSHADASVSALVGRSGGKKTAERYQVQLGGDADAGKRSFLFGKLGWDRNRFSGIDDRWSAGGGGGRNWIKTEPRTLKTLAGLKYVREDRTTGERKISPTAFAGIRGRLAAAAAVELGQSVFYDRDLSDGGNWRLESASFLKAMLSGHLAWKAGYTVDYRENPVRGFKRTDALFSTALVIDF